jgi:monoamine oxidase
MSSPAGSRVDTAVIGGGVAGTYAAWRLQQALPHSDVALFEMSDRVGGRLRSIAVPGLPHVTAELGGMRFLPDRHRMVAGLVGQLGLPVTELPPAAPPGDDGSGNLVFVRGRLLRIRELGDPRQVPYRLAPEERGHTAEQLREQLRLRFAPPCGLSRPPGFEAPTLGRPLYAHGFWDLVSRTHSSEARQLMLDCFPEMGNGTAALALRPSDLGASVPALTIAGGFDRLPTALAGRFTAAGGELACNHRLLGIEGHAGEPYLLRFVRTRPEQAPHVHAADRVLVRAAKVVLALPRRSLELVHWDALRADRKLGALLRSVAGGAAVRLFLAYPAPWWRALGITAGRSLTDLPIRQTRYLATEGEMPGGDPANRASLLMVGWSDARAVRWWRSRHPTPPAAPAPGGPIVREVQRQLALAHGLTCLPEPSWARYHDWTQDPFGAGWHVWRPGVRFWEVMPALRRPSGEEVSICGEAYSLRQGWVEGALQSAELMLQERFGLPPAECWLPPHLGQ